MRHPGMEYLRGLIRAARLNDKSMLAVADLTCVITYGHAYFDVDEDFVQQVLAQVDGDQVERVKAICNEWAAYLQSRDKLN